MPPRNPHARICVSDTVTPALPFFNRFPKLCEHISPCQLEAVLPNHLPSRNTFRSQGKHIPGSSQPGANNWDVLSKPRAQSSSALREEFCFFNLRFHDGPNACQTGSFISSGGICRQAIQVCFVGWKQWDAPGAAGEQPQEPRGARGCVLLALLS